MYKVPIEVLEMFRDQLKITGDMLDIEHKGGKIRPIDVNEILMNNTKLLQLIKDNYGI